MRNRSGRSTSRTSRGPNVPWVLLAALFMLVIFVDALLIGEWIFALGIAISAVGAGSYYLYVDGGKANRKLWISANGLLVAGIVVIILGRAFG